jgi:putative tryptophan/tyrosine transport system substrate-binding protein
MELLRQVLPDVHSIAALINPNSPRAEDDAGNVRDAARSLGLSIRVIEANTIDTIDAALETAARERVGAVTVVADPLFIQHGPRITALATARSLPVIYPWRVQAEGGGLMSYGTSLGVAYEKLGVYAAKILKNIKPADLPVEQPTKFELIINLKTAKTLGLAIPPSVLARADEVIE